MSNIKGFFDPTAFSEMQAEACSSSGAMNTLNEDPELSFPSSQSNYFISSNNSQMSGFVSDLAFYHAAAQGGGYASTSSEGGPPSGSFMYTNDSPNEPHHHFMSPNGTFTTTPSPTSSISSSSIHNNFGATGGGGTGTPMYNNIGASEYAAAYNEYPGPSDCAIERSTRGYELKRKYYNDGSKNPSSSSASSSRSTLSLVTQQNNSATAFVGNNNYHHHNHRDDLHRNGNNMYGSAIANKHKSKYLGAQIDTTGTKKAISHVKCTSREKTKKKCSNCHAINSPSWRRSIAKHSKGDLLCNACGLYEKTAKKKRMLVTADDGNTKVVRKRDARDYCCSTCGAKDVTRWRRLHDTVQCEKCARAQRSHK